MALLRRRLWGQQRPVGSTLGVLLPWSQQADFLRRIVADDGVGKAGGDFGVPIIDRCAAAHDFHLALRQTGGLSAGSA